jgi:hypothetical protein
MSVNDYELNFNKFSSKKTKFRVGYIGTPQSSENILDIKLFIDTAAAVEALNLNIVFFQSLNTLSDCCILKQFHHY